MIDWKSANWRIAQQASEFAYSEIDALLTVRPDLLREIGWAGVAALRNVLMAAWLGRQIAA